MVIIIRCARERANIFKLSTYATGLIRRNTLITNRVPSRACGLST